MFMKKAEEIYNSLGVINVTYNDEPIWIEDLNKERKTALIRQINDQELMEVSVYSLAKKPDYSQED